MASVVKHISSTPNKTQPPGKTAPLSYPLSFVWRLYRRGGADPVLSRRLQSSDRSLGIPGAACPARAPRGRQKRRAQPLCSILAPPLPVSPSLSLSRSLQVIHSIIARPRRFTSAPGGWWSNHGRAGDNIVPCATPGNHETSRAGEATGAHPAKFGTQQTQRRRR